MNTTRIQSAQSWSLLTCALAGAIWLTSCSRGTDVGPDPEPTLPSTTVTMPSTVTATGSLTDIVSRTPHLSLLNAALTRAGLAESFRTGSRTLFAPTDEAFRAAGYAKSTLDSLSPAQVQRILQYHVLNSRLAVSTLPVNTPTPVPTALVTASMTLFKASDGRLFANAARIVQADIGAMNSVMFVIDRLMPVPSLSTLELIRANPELSLFRQAIDRAGATVLTALQSSAEGGITVFAPTNAAFRAAGYADADAVRSAEPARLAEVLRYHVVNRRTFSPMLLSGDVATVQGTPLSIAVSEQGATLTGRGNPVTGATLLQTDLTATNGVVHLIDRVLLPTAVNN
ncbi:fasciclin domain-containing protein [Rudanella paleaurantiibacter]|uniref:Fasciclin domain-containing protein n=1 Tax=Rudanella paleaurantiibacter TaxID=2614655 RepID=A0A7J5U0F4_9BACT|nr:fasciclin domain-containing protein [Rudanella paleaurantiibacter]KAB7731011.1 fasciclin domain-containing protein [Rudanella paleaurantiibacter]